MITSRSLGKLAYTTRLRFSDEGDGSHSDFIVATFLIYSLYVLPNGLEDGLSPYVFSLAILIVKGVRFALALCIWVISTWE